MQCVRLESSARVATGTAWAAALVAGLCWQPLPVLAADDLTIAGIAAGRLYVRGTTSQPRQQVVLDDRFETTSDDARVFRFELVYHPASCIVGARIGAAVRQAVVSNCGQQAPSGEAAGAPSAEAPGARQVSLPEPSEPANALPPSEASPQPGSDEPRGAAEAAPPPSIAAPAPQMQASIETVPAAAVEPDRQGALVPTMRAPIPPARPADAKLRVRITSRSEPPRQPPAMPGATNPAKPDDKAAKAEAKSDRPVARAAKASPRKRPDPLLRPDDR